MKYIEKPEELTEKLDVPRLGRYGIAESDLDRIASASGNKNNPVQFTHEEIIGVLKKRL